jgi:hypothetical protein
MIMTPIPYDRMTEVIERTIGPNDAYPSETQLSAHRAKQALREKQFGNQDITKEAHERLHHQP